MDNKFARIKLLAMDVDGTLTQGEMIILDGHQLKVFNVYDGLGVRLAVNYGLRVAWITGNTSTAVAVRAKTLGVTDVYQGARFKTEALDDLMSRYGLDRDEVAYMGDDLNDLPAFGYVGLSIAVCNAADELKARADFITQHEGGRGAVREAIEIILKSRGEWDKAVESYLDELRTEQTEKTGPEAVA